MDKRYQHDQYEKKIYSLWEKSGGFSPPPRKASEGKAPRKEKPFTIIMPPPNANDPLHIGHAMFVTVEDILIRFHRMLGEATLWLPGTDHAGIETQFVFEKKLKEQGKSRFDFDRETLYKKIWDYVQENSDVAVEQLKRIGASADWSRFKFTLDTDIVEVVLDTFQQLVKDGLVYRDLSLVNYCTHCGTAFSELEVKHIERTTPLYYMKYGPFTLATVRPETKFGDTAVAVNPSDKRYKKWVGKTVEVRGLLGRFSMNVVADEYVDPEFGTGVIKVTPAHDPNDFAIWQRHKDEVPGPKQVIGFDGKLNEKTGTYKGLTVAEARKIVASDLQKEGLLEKVDTTYTHSVGVCYRCATTIEPLPMPQFFIKVKPLTTMVLKALKNKEVVIHGAGHDKILKHWLEDLKDWNISRQIVWGIRQPVWYDTKENQNIEVTFIDKDGQKQSGKLKVFFGGSERVDHPPQSSLIDRKKIVVADTKQYSLKEISDGLQELRAPVGTPYVVSPTSPGESFIQETDTFDTWFSSGQWPFATLLAQSGSFKSQNPNFKQISKSKFQNSKLEKTTADLERFYPTQVMETAYDILIFWVMRMLMLGLYRTGNVPFEQVYLHGLVRDEKGQKMSKSKGNVINPISVIEKYGADALRMALVMSTTAGRDSATGEEKIRGMRNFTNKIWNAARFIMMKREGGNEEILRRSGLSPKTRRAQDDKAGLKSVPALSNVAGDKEFVRQLNTVVKRVTRQLEKLKVGLAAETVYKEFWHWFCDECIEKNKKDEISDGVLVEGLQTFLRLLHPFVPFVTEAIWQELYEKKLVEEKLLLTTAWPRIAEARGEPL